MKHGYSKCVLPHRYTLAGTTGLYFYAYVTYTFPVITGTFTGVHTLMDCFTLFVVFVQPHRSYTYTGKVQPCRDVVHPLHIQGREPVR